MNTLSTSSAVVNLVALDLNEIDTCYCDIGHFIRRFKNFFGESDPTTETKSIRELENSIFKTVSKECIEFCNSRDLTVVLADCLKRAKDTFSNIVKLSAQLDCFKDDDCESNEHVVIRLDVDSNLQIVLQEYDQMVCWIAENVTPNKSEYFTINVRRV